MAIWDKVGELAKRILGSDTTARPRNLSEVEDAIVPERAVQRGGKFTSKPSPPDDVEVLPEYEFILEALRAGCPALFVTGRAGTGKSTLIHWLAARLESCAVVAPTAIAAVGVNGDTIHSFFGLPPRHLDPDEDYAPGRKVRLVLENLKCLIVDEASMVLPNVVDVMDRILRSVRRSNVPFGGVPVVFVGDLLQLPPVVSSPEEALYYSHRYRTHYFFSADVFQGQDIVPVVLNKVRRQADPEFIDALDRIRRNDNCRDAVAMINRRCYRDRASVGDSGVYLVPTNKAAKSINTRELDKLSGALELYEAGVTGNLPASQWKLPVSDRLELKVGARILFLKNKKPEWINGDLGEVVGFERDFVRVRKASGGNVVIVGRETWVKQKYVYDYEKKRIEREEVGTFAQFPLALGWAITIHKSQGLTLDQLVLDLGGGAFADGQTYVALSRARTIEGITLARPIQMRDVRADAVVLDFYKRLGLLD